ncbi:MAG TPA: ABC transporter permease [Dictyoglomaceae bacterium]|nr:ABC transporter permease [Dictyoglomaceae bacterium]HOP94542.1 ABC transporter permease [Dictyoglomaceae bacterium]HPU43094.1 ABC transporter permease [Dictyoglomaceae bacterium]
MDKIVEQEIQMNVAMRMKDDPTMRGFSEEQKQNILESRVRNELKRRGMDQPFIIRSIYHLKRALVLDLGNALNMTSDSGSMQVKNIILERIPLSVLLFTTITIIEFLLSLYFGLKLSRNYGSFWDKLVVYFSPLSTIPGWFYGIFFIMIFYSWLHILPPGGFMDFPPPPTAIGRILNVIKHMILPISSWILSFIFLGIYSQKNFFLIYSTEDYVEVAKAKGLPDKDIERKYILRPALPPIITSFALSVISSWMGAIVTEVVFNWPGLGMVLSRAIGSFDAPVIVGVTVIYAYLLGATVLLLDFVYALVDPRVRI